MEMNIVAKTFLSILLVFVGGLYIRLTVTNFIEGRYFFFGTYLMLAIWMVLCLARNVFE